MTVVSKTILTLKYGSITTTDACAKENPCFIVKQSMTEYSNESIIQRQAVVFQMMRTALKFRQLYNTNY